MNAQTQSETESKPAAPAGCSVLSPQPQASDEIDAFISHVSDGVRAWVAAGKALLSMLRRDPDVFKKIMARCEWLTLDALETFARIGRMELRPEVLLLSDSVQKRVIRLGYSQQTKLLDERVPVVIDFTQEGRPLVQKKRLTDVTAKELDLVLDGAKIRTPHEQAEVLKTRIADRNIQVARPAMRLPEPETPTRKVMFLGSYRIVFRFGKPELVKCADLAVNAQRILLSKDIGGDLAAVLELTKWSDTP